MNTTEYAPTARTAIVITQQCTSCKLEYGLDVMLSSCPSCKGRLEYMHAGHYNRHAHRDSCSIWDYFDLIPLRDPANIVSLGEGGSDIIEIEELSQYVNGARLFIMMDSEKNPTGVFKDREASIILSRCRELGLNDLVFYSTANTGRSYTHYAATIGLNSYLFMPLQCHYKNTTHIQKNRNNFIIYVDDNYSEIAPFARKFAEQNGLTPIAPLHDRNEAYATVAYEQHEKLPECNYFVQTIASGMGPIGFLRGHKTLVRLGLEQPYRVPRIVCVQSSQMNVMSTAYNSEKKILNKEDMPAMFANDLYEPTLNSTNPVNNYPALFDCLKETDGIITDVIPDFVEETAPPLLKALNKRGLILRTDLEKSVVISFAGLVRLGRQNRFSRGEVILMLACGRGKDNTTDLYSPEAVINPRNCDVLGLKKQLDQLL